MNKNELINIKITDVTHEGQGVARYEGKVVFVPQALENEEIECKVLKATKNIIYGKINKVLVPSENRTQPECPVYYKCGGCNFMHASYDTELQIKQKRVKDCFERIGNFSVPLEPIIGSDRQYSYRNKAQFPVRIDVSGSKCGFYRQSSHEIVDIDKCFIQNPSANSALIALRVFLNKYKTAYDESTHTGEIKTLYVRTGETTKQVQVVIVTRTKHISHKEELIKLLLEYVPSLVSIVQNINTEKTNVILCEKYITLHGKDKIVDEILGVKFYISPAAFYQINNPQTEKLYSKALEYAALTGSETVLDLYCGIGTISLCAANKAKQVIGIEIVERAIEDARENAKLNNINNAEFIVGDATYAAKLLKDKNLKPDVIIIDPPRKGCDEELLKTIKALSPDRLVYVSCDPATLARDIKILIGHGFTPTTATPLDMFPKTGHVECIVLLSQINTQWKTLSLYQ